MFSSVLFKPRAVTNLSFPVSRSNFSIIAEINKYNEMTLYLSSSGVLSGTSNVGNRTLTILQLFPFESNTILFIHLFGVSNIGVTDQFYQCVLCSLHGHEHIYYFEVNRFSKG